jgi:nicotinamide-nucleotide amidase
MSAHTLTEQLAEVLQQHGWMLATAESCTGGMIAASCTDLSGSSNWFERAYITYSNQAKHEDLGVPSQLIDQYGAVSIEVAQAMSEGLVKNSAIDIGLAISGVAGPTGGSPEKPVGYVCFAWAWKDQSGVHYESTAKNFITGAQSINEQTREQVRTLARDFSLTELLRILKNSDQ